MPENEMMETGADGIVGKLQVRLFNRNAHSVSLTDAGQFFYERVNFMLRYDKDTKKRLIAIAEQYRGHVKVGIDIRRISSPVS